MKKRLMITFVLAVVIVFAAGISSMAAEEGNFTYNTYGGIATVTLISGEGTVEVPDTLGGYQVVALDIYRPNTEITEIKLPETILTINRGFSGWTALTKANIPSAIVSLPAEMFKDCPISEITLPERLKSIGDRAFQGSSLTKISFPETLTYIGESAFQGCPLTSVQLNEGIEEIRRNAFNGCEGISEVTLPESLYFLGNNVFANTGVTKLIIPANVSKWEGTPFSDYKNLKELVVKCANIPRGMFSVIDVEKLVLAEGVETMDYNTMSHGSGEGTRIGDLWLPASLKSTGRTGSGAHIDCITIAGYDADNYANLDLSGFTRHTTEVRVLAEIEEIPDEFLSDNFSNESIKKISLPAGVKKIGSYAFSGCKNLETITPLESVETIGRGAFSGCSSLAELELSDCFTEIGGYAFSNCSSLKEIKLPACLKAIGERAFDGCSSIAEIELPVGLESLGDYAFRSTAIKSVSVPDMETVGQHVFADCTNLTKIEVGKGVSNIPRLVQGTGYLDENNIVTVTVRASVTEIPNGYMNASVRDNMTSLTTVNLLGPVTSIGDRAFYSCKYLANINIPTTLETLGENAFYGTAIKRISIPDSLINIGSGPFANCMALKEIEVGNIKVSVFDLIKERYSGADNNVETIIIRDGVTAIPDGLCSSMSGVTKVVVPDSVTSIGNNAFWHCRLLKSIQLPKGLQSIGDSAFEQCESLGKIELPDAVTSIGVRAFGYCTSLQLSRFPSSLERIYDGAFVQCEGLKGEYDLSGVSYISDVAFSGCIGITKISIPNCTERLGGGAFMRCKALEEVIMPEKCVVYASDIFNGCSSLKVVSVPSNWNNIPDRTFNGCSSLTKLIIPSGVTRIGEEAFGGCSGITEILLPDSVTYIGDGAFEGSGIIEITIPAAVNNIGDYAFANCHDLTFIDVHFRNQKYLTGSDGILCNKSGNTLLAVPGALAAGGSWDVPLAISSIEAYAFMGCRMKRLTIRNNVSYISDYAFVDCPEVGLYVSRGGYAEGYAKRNRMDYFYSIDNTEGKGLYAGRAGRLGKQVYATVMNDTNKPVESAVVYVAQLDTSNNIISVSKHEVSIGAREKCAVYAESAPQSYRVDIFVWDENMNPLTDNIRETIYLRD